MMIGNCSLGRVTSDVRYCSNTLIRHERNATLW